MMLRGALIVCLLAICLTDRAAAMVRTFPAQGTLRFEFHDAIDLPVYSWPRTLLAYPVDFSQAAVSANQLQLIDDPTGQPVDFQLSDVQTDSAGHLITATVNFFSDLPPGQTRSFDLKKGDRTAGGPGVSIHDTVGAEINVDAGTIGVVLPISQAIVNAHEAPGPII